MKPPTFIQVRATVLFGTGVAGIIYETVVSQTDRPTLLILFSALVGVPLFLKADEKTTPVQKPAEPVEKKSE